MSFLLDNGKILKLNIPGPGPITSGLINRSISNYSNSEVKTIGISAFAHASLISVNFPECTSIGNYAFYVCTKLRSINFPECTTIGDYAFAECRSSLASVSFPKCRTIGEYAFDACAYLTSVYIPECTSIGNYAFSTINEGDCTLYINVNENNMCNINSLAFPLAVSSKSTITNYIYTDNIYVAKAASLAINSFTNTYTYHLNGEDWTW